MRLTFINDGISAGTVLGGYEGDMARAALKALPRIPEVNFREMRWLSVFRDEAERLAGAVDALETDQMFVAKWLKRMKLTGNWRRTEEARKVPGRVLDEEAQFSAVVGAAVPRLDYAPAYADYDIVFDTLAGKKPSRTRVAAVEADLDGLGMGAVRGLACVLSVNDGAEFRAKILPQLMAAVTVVIGTFLRAHHGKHPSQSHGKKLVIARARFLKIKVNEPQVGKVVESNRIRAERALLRAARGECGDKKCPVKASAYAACKRLGLL